MYEWRENANGNWILPMGEDGIITVFLRKDESWAGVYEGRFTFGSYESAEEAMEDMERIMEGDTSMLKPVDTGWIRNKTNHGYHRTKSGIDVSVKRARSGNWYIVLNGELQAGRWFRTEQEAFASAEKLLAELEREYW